VLKRSFQQSLIESRRVAVEVPSSQKAIQRITSS
jgi:hypothetical protein